MRNRKHILLGGLVGATMLIVWLLPKISSRPEFSIRVLPTGQIAGAGWCFIAAITNTGRSSPIVDTVRVEWRDAVGNVEGFRLFSGSNRPWLRGHGEVTTFLIPVRAQSVRVCVLHDTTGFFKRNVSRVASKLPLDRTPNLLILLYQRGLLFPEPEPYPGEWKQVHAG